jgi:hypothetical protein
MKFKVCREAKDDSITIALIELKTTYYVVLNLSPPKVSLIASSQYEIVCGADMDAQSARQPSGNWVARHVSNLLQEVK